MCKQFWGILAIIVLIFAGIFIFSGNGKNSASSAKTNAKPTEHIEGLGKSGVTLVEYGDYECPYCEEYYPTIKQVQQEFNDQISFQFRNFPLVSIHQNA